MVHCWAEGCAHNNIKETCKFYRIPAEEKLRKQWLNLLRKTLSPKKERRICSCHFKDGNKENLPTIFSRNINKQFGFHYLSPEHKRRRRASKGKIPVKKKLNFLEEPETLNLQQEPKPIASTSKEALPEPAPKLREDISVNILPEPIASTSKEALPELATKLREDISVNILPEPMAYTSKEELSTSSREGSSRESSTERETLLAVDNYFLMRDIEKFKITKTFSFVDIESNENLIMFYTGIPSKLLFNSLFNLIQNVDINYYKFNVTKLSKKDQLFMTFVKLRRNFPHVDLAFRFGVSVTTVANIITTYIYVLHEILVKQLMGKIPSIHKNKSCLPNAFAHFTNCRIIIDCTEIYTDVPRKSMCNQKKTFSNYKQRNTLKGLVGVAPNGVVTFLSDLYPGATSDKQIVADSKLLSKLEAGDLVLADKGFLIREMMPEGTFLNIPPFLTTLQFTREQVKQTEQIARARIHVERAIRRMKCFKILSKIPFTLIKHSSVIFKVCGALTNLENPLIKEVKSSFDE